MTSATEKIRQTIHKHRLLKAGDQVLVAISGGPDSVLLAFALRQLGYDIALAHVNYQLRGEASMQDEALVRQYARQWQVPLHVKQLDLYQALQQQGDSLQMAARAERYAFFEEVMRSHGYHACALGHHAGDQLENILMTLLGGNSRRIWKAMPVKRGPYVRPLIELSREEILQELQRHQLAWRLDASNEKTDYLRNKFRHQLIPVLEEIQPKAQAHLLEKYHWYGKQMAFADVMLKPFLQQAATDEQGYAQLDWTRFEQQVGKEHLPVLLAAVLEQWGIHGHALWECLRLLHSQSGKWVATPQGRVVRTRKGLSLMPARQHGQKLFVLQPFEGKKHFLFCGMKWTCHLPHTRPPDFSRPHTFYLDAEKLVWPLHIRPWQPGDRMQPLGMKNTKKLSDIFIDEKFSPLQKQQALVIEDQQEIVALLHFRIAEKVRIRPESKQILCISVKMP